MIGHRKSAVSKGIAGNSVLLGILLILAGQMVTALTPFLTGALVDYAQLSLAQSSDVIAAITGGIMLGTLIVLLKGHVWNRRMLAYCALLLVIGGNALALKFHNYHQLIVIEVLAGIGSGVAIALGAMVIAGAGGSAKYFGMLMVVLGATNAVTAYFVPYAVQYFGINGLYIILLAYGVCGLFVPRYLVSPIAEIQEKNHDGKINQIHSPVIDKVSAVVGVIVTLVIFSGYAAFWPFLERIATNSGVEASTFGQSLSIALLCGGLAGVVASFVGDRFGHIRPLVFSCLIISVGAVAITFLLTDFTVRFILPFFQFGYLFMLIYNNASLSLLDSSGRVLVFGVFMETSGWFVGPLLAGQIIRFGGSYNTLSYFLLVTTLVYITAKILMAVRVKHRLKNVSQVSSMGLDGAV